jgi:hypothetical protein
MEAFLIHAPWCILFSLQQIDYCFLHNFHIVAIVLLFQVCTSLEETLSNREPGLVVGVVGGRQQEQVSPLA